MTFKQYYAEILKSFPELTENKARFYWDYAYTIEQAIYSLSNN